MGLYTLQEPYSLATWYNYQGAYDLNAGTDLLLDLSRNILESDAYIYQGRAFPKGSDCNIGYNQTFSGTLNLTPYSYLVALTGFTRNSNQFTLRIYDKGAQADVYYGQFAWYPTVISNMTGQFNNGDFIVNRDRDKPFGPYFFRDPLIMLPPGVLQVQVTNVEVDPSSPTFMQMLFHLAVPKSTVSLNNRRVQTASDPTGLETVMGLTNLAG